MVFNEMELVKITQVIDYPGQFEEITAWLTENNLTYRHTGAIVDPSTFEPITQITIIDAPDEMITAYHLKWGVK